MRKIVLALGLGASACAPLSVEPRPDTARLTAERLVVGMGDGSTCAADWKAEGGAGTLQPCALSYRVMPEANPNPLRKASEAVLGAVGARAAQPPMAVIEVTDGAGRVVRFVSPLPLPPGSRN